MMEKACKWSLLAVLLLVNLALAYETNVKLKYDADKVHPSALWVADLLKGPTGSPDLDSPPRRILDSDRENLDSNERILDPYGGTRDSTGRILDPYGGPRDTTGRILDPYGGPPDTTGRILDPYRKNLDSSERILDPYGPPGTSGRIVDPYGGPPDTTGRILDPYKKNLDSSERILEPYGPPSTSGRIVYPYGGPPDTTGRMLHPLLGAPGTAGPIVDAYRQNVDSSESFVDPYRTNQPVRTYMEDMSKTRAAIKRQGLNARDLVVINGRSYFFGTTALSNNDAMSMCNDLAMVMISLETQTEHQAIDTFLVTNGRSQNYITSGILHNGIWKWSGSGRKVTYSKWIPGQPYNPENDKNMCIYNSASGWGDNSCSGSKSNVICEQTCA